MKAWTAEEAVRLLRELERFDVEFCEQPVPAGHPEQLRYVRERSPIPIVTDEDSLHTADDLPQLIGCVDGVNVKLTKTGGIRGADRDDPYGARARNESHARLHGRVADLRNGGGAHFAAGRLGRHRRAVSHQATIRSPASRTSAERSFCPMLRDWACVRRLAVA